jgi:hypothetical protein
VTDEPTRVVLEWRYDGGWECTNGPWFCMIPYGDPNNLWAIQVRGEKIKTDVASGEEAKEICQALQDALAGFTYELGIVRGGRLEKEASIAPTLPKFEVGQWVTKDGVEDLRWHISAVQPNGSISFDRSYSGLIGEMPCPPPHNTLLPFHIKFYNVRVVTPPGLPLRAI